MGDGRPTASHTEEKPTHGRMAHWRHDPMGSSVQGSLDHPLLGVGYADDRARAGRRDGVVELLSEIIEGTMRGWGVDRLGS